jgi:RND family efflux transporter MFP subunit
MAVRRPSFAFGAVEFTGALLAEREMLPRAQLTADHLVQRLPGTAAIVYVLQKSGDSHWVPKATAGEIAVAQAVTPESGGLGLVAERRAIVILDGDDLSREEYAHLDTRRTVAFLVYAPLISEGEVIGAVEIVNYDGAFMEDIRAHLEDVTEVAAPALAAAVAYEDERNSMLHSISRVTQMYDLEKVFNSNLELDALLETIATKFQEVLQVQGVNVWMVDAEGVKLVSRAGTDPTVELNSIQVAGQGIAGDVSDSGESLLIDHAEDPRLVARNAKLEQGAVFSILAVPLMDRENLVGVVEAINRIDRRPFDEDDQFLLTNICETANNALHNATLLQAERKVEVLQTLVKVSREITSTLDIQRVLQTVVNDVQSVVSYDRAAIALEQRGSLQLKALSGSPQINFSDPTVKMLKDMLEWASLSNDEIHVVQRGDEIDVSREASRAKFSEYFAATGARAFYALPLDDDQGRLGIISFESQDPDFLTHAHFEIIRVLAAQVTVALRNASLYRDVPFIGILEPVLEKKRKFLALEKRRRAAMLATAAAVVLFLVIVPIPMRLAGDATVAPLRRAQIAPAVEGVVKAVHVREGDRVQAGTILADLEDWDYRAAAAEAKAKYETALSTMNRALAANDGSEAGVQRVQADFWAAELNRAQERLDRTHLRSPIDGIVTTPHIENFVGRHLSASDTFVEVIDSAQSNIDVALDEQESVFLRPGEGARVKLDSFPTQSFAGEVQVVSPVNGFEGDEKVFFARVLVANPNAVIKPGMQGRCKIMAGWHPAGYVLFRRPAMWIYSKLWSWFGW